MTLNSIVPLKTSLGSLKIIGNGTVHSTDRMRVLIKGKNTTKYNMN